MDLYYCQSRSCPWVVQTESGSSSGWAPIWAGSERWSSCEEKWRPLSTIQQSTICSDPEPGIGGRYLHGCFPWQLTCLSSFINFYATKPVGGKLAWVPESGGEGAGNTGRYKTDFSRDGRKVPTPPTGLPSGPQPRAHFFHCLIKFW